MSASLASSPVLVADVGTSTTRLGYAGNADPTYVLPTTCAWTEPRSYDTFMIGHNALAHPPCSSTTSSLWHSGGVVRDWTLMEEYWRHLFYRYACVEPTGVGLVLAEPVGVPPRQRATTAEILFETFGVPRLFIGSQALFALDCIGGGADTALIVESGAGVTQVVPVVDGYAVDGAAQQFPLAGKDVTQYVLDSLRERQRTIDAARAWDTAERIKTSCTYTTKHSLAREMARFDARPDAHFVTHRELHSRTGAPYELQVGYEQFLAAEVFFQPALLHPQWTTSLPQLVDAVIWACPVDCRRRLYANVMLSGGNTRFPHFARRFKKALHALLAQRTAGFLAASGSAQLDRHVQYEVHVRDGAHVEHAVWKGGSAFGASAAYAQAATTRTEYLERGFV